MQSNWPGAKIDENPLALVLSDQNMRWRRGDRFWVEGYLERDPNLRSNGASVCKLIYNEIALRIESAETPSYDEYVARFPEHAKTFAEWIARNEAPEPYSIEEPTKSNLPALSVYDTPPQPKRRKRRGPIPPSIPDYEFLAFIASGGQGDVFQARHLPLNRIVALKVLPHRSALDEEQVVRFHREGKLSANLDHRNIISIYDYDEWEERLYYSMEFAPGGCLKARLDREHVLSPRDAAELVVQLANAVQYAHDQHVVHRDLKPGNILFGKNGVPKIGDFGLAKSLTTNSVDLTMTKAIIGTAGFMSPEQAAGKGKHVKSAADIYGLGAILYATLTGHAPFEDDDLVNLFIKVRTETPLPPSRLNRNVPDELEQICMTCLATDPENRFSAASDVADVLQFFLDFGTDTGKQQRPTWRLGSRPNNSAEVEGEACTTDGSNAPTLSERKHDGK